MNKELLKGYIDLIILSIVKHEKNYGYNIIKEIYGLSNNNFELKECTLYLALKRLEKNEFVTSEWDNDNTYPRRKYYEITNKGNQYLNKEFNDILMVNKFLHKLIKRSEMNSNDKKE